MITIGIATFNRMRILKMMAKSFYSAENRVKYNVRIYDDSSSEYGVDFLRKLFPDAVSITKHDKNLGADGNMRFMYEDFLKNDDEFFFNADSDLIFSHQCIDKALELMTDTDGVLNLFNTPYHKTIMQSGLFTEKKSLGAAGTLFSRECVADFMTGLSREKTTSAFDWRWSEYLRKKGYRLLAVTDSMVQHIGVDGFNSSLSNMAYGKGFHVDTLTNGQILNDVLEIATEDRDPARQRKWYAVFPFEEVPKNSKVIIYGAGLVGQDYKKQIEHTRYCKCVAVLDKNYYKYTGVLAPKKLLNLEYDYIVLAAVKDEIIRSMIDDIKLMGKHLVKCIVIKKNDRIIRL